MIFWLSDGGSKRKDEYSIMKLKMNSFCFAFLLLLVYTKKSISKYTQKYPFT